MWVWNCRKNSQIPFMGDAATQTKGESWALGWNAAANYAFDSKNEIGLVYRSKVTHTMEADFKAYMALHGDEFTKSCLWQSNFARQLGYWLQS
ncbi:outer membrane protein transport protein [Phascolarctobacterium faecium]|uniref:outer membrane protein transport protein n=1 Tax=Phascolarctobacterium faecium TaxID=33025 RepID=UPI00338F3B03